MKPVHLHRDRTPCVADDTRSRATAWPILAVFMALVLSACSEMTGPSPTVRTDVEPETVSYVRGYDTADAEAWARTEYELPITSSLRWPMRSSIEFRCDHSRAWIFLRFRAEGQLLNLVGRRIGGTYSAPITTYTVPVEWEMGGQINTNLAQRGIANILHFRPYEDTIRRLPNNRYLIVTLNHFPGDALVFKYWIKEISDEIADARRRCEAL